MQSLFEDRSYAAALRWHARTAVVLPDDWGRTLRRARLQRKLRQQQQFAESLRIAQAQGAPPQAILHEQWLALAEYGLLEDEKARFAAMLNAAEIDVGDLCESFVRGYIRTFRIGDAVDLLEVWQADAPQDWLPWQLQTEIQLGQSEHRAAVSSAQRALALRPDDFASLMLLGAAHVALREYPAAVAAYERAATVVPTSEHAQLALATCAAHQGDAETQERRLKLAQAAAPESADVKLALARFQLEHGEAELVISTLDQPSRDPQWNLIRGQALAQTGRTEEGKKLIADAQAGQAALDHTVTLMENLLQEPGNVAARLEIGQTLARFGQEEKGREWIESVLVFDRENTIARQLLQEWPPSD